MKRYSGRAYYPCGVAATLVAVLVITVVPFDPSEPQGANEFATGLSNALPLEPSPAIPEVEATFREWVLAANSACNPRVAVCE